MQELKELGLSDNEIIIYTTLLRAGVSTANKIAQVSGIKRSTTYDNLQLLISKGLVASSMKNNVYHYLAANPEKLSFILEERLKRLQSIIPQLEEMQGSNEKKTGVIYYDGKKGVRTVLADVLENSGEKFYYVGSRKMAKIPLAHYPDNFVRKRVEANIRLYGKLADEDKTDSFVDDANAQNLSEITYDKSLNGSSAIMFLYSDKVSFITNKQDPVGVIIENKDIRDFLFSLIFKN